MDFSPNGQNIATSSEDRTVKIWDTHTGILLYSLENHTKGVKSVNYSPDGKKIVSASFDHTAIIWDATIGQQLYVLDSYDTDHHINAPTNGINTAIFSPDGKTIITAAGDNTAKLWDVESGKLIRSFSDQINSNRKDKKKGKKNIENQFKGHSGPVISASFSTDGNSILTVSKDRTAKLWEVSSGKVLHTFSGLNWLNPIAIFSPDNKNIITVTNDRKIKKWDIISGEIIDSLLGHKREIVTIMFQPKTNVLLSISENRISHFWDMEEMKLIESKISPLQLVQPLFSKNSLMPLFDAEGKYLISGNFDIQIIDLATGEINHTIKKDKPGRSFTNSVLSPDGKWLLTSYDDHTASLWNMSSGVLAQSFKGFSSRPVGYKFNNDYNQILSAYNDNYVRVWNCSKGEIVKAFKAHDEYIQFIDYSPDGKLFLTASGDFSTKVWDSQSFNLIRTFSGHLSGFSFAQFTTDNKQIITTSGKKIRIWDIQTNRIKYTIEEEGYRDILTRISPDGKTLLAATSGSANLWDISSGGLLHKLGGTYGHWDNIVDGIFSRDGKIIVTSDLLITKVWETHTGKLISSLAGNRVGGSAEISFDGKILLISNRKTSSHDKIFSSIWDVDGTLIANLNEEATFCPEGKMVVTESKNVVMIFEEKIGKWRLSYDINGDYYNSISWDNNITISAFQSSIVLSNRATKKEIASFIPVNNSDYITILPNGYFKATKDASSKLFYVKGIQPLGFDQLDIKYNRPDKVLKALGEAFGNPDTTLINATNRAWKKRVQKLGVDTTSFEDGFSIPKSDFRNRDNLNYEQNNREIKLQVWGIDTVYKLDRFNVWVNEVPIFGMKGVSLRNLNINHLDTTISILLTEGKNRIETAVLNINGTESYRLPLYVNYLPKVPSTERLYFVGIGVDNYKQVGHNLKYSVKDIRDLVINLKNKYGENIIIDTLFNENVSHERILAVKKNLLTTNINDRVIISFSGHGLLSSSYDYYLAMHSTNFSKPEEGGLPYEDLEWLLDSIPARKKLLLIDACHSGEVDKEDLIAMNNSNKTDGIKGAQMTYEYEPTLGMKNSFELMQELFTNVNRGTGATIISAAAGTQYAYERGDLANGVFTYCILELMNQRDKISVSELKTLVGKRVEELTNGLQKPTSRNETVENDWWVW
jgi:WD40 repeat protein